MPSIRATPFVPGRGRGILRRGVEHAAPDSILLISYRDLKPFPAQPAALVIIGGTPLAHPMIRLFGLGIPTVVITPEQEKDLAEGAELVVDGAIGLIATRDQEIPPETRPAAESPRPGTPIKTADGKEVALRVSIADSAGAAGAIAAGATAIGMVRSEFLVPPDGSLPDARFFEAALGEICEAAHPLPVTVRLLDLVDDKRPPWLGPLPGMKGPLGLRGIRLYGTEPVSSALRAEVEALGRLGARFDLSLLLPFVARPEEFIHWRREIEDLLPGPMAVAPMVETPAAALAMAEWMEMTDLVAVGCNDLMQCLYGADRDIAEVTELLDPYAPVMFRLLRQIADVAGDKVSQVQLCGLLPQVPGVLPVLLGLGYRAFSVESLLVPYLAQTLSKTDTYEAEACAVGVCAASDSDSVREILGLPPSSSWATGATALRH